MGDRATTALREAVWRANQAIGRPSSRIAAITARTMLLAGPAAAMTMNFWR